MKKIFFFVFLMTLMAGCSVLEQQLARLLKKEAEKAVETIGDKIEKTIDDKIDPSTASEKTPKDSQFDRKIVDSSDIYNVISGTVSGSLYQQIMQKTPRTGDLILRASSDPESLAISLGTLSGYSHAGILMEENEEWYVIDVNKSNQNTVGKKKLEKWLENPKNAEMLHAITLTPNVMLKKDEQEKLRIILAEWLEKGANKKTKWDNSFDTNNDAVYCTEFIHLVYKNFYSGYEPLDNGKVLKKIAKRILESQDEIIIKNQKEIKTYYNVIKNSEKIITPASFLWSNQFRQNSYAKHENIRYKFLDALYAKTFEKYRAIRHLNGTKNTAEIEKELADFHLTKDDMLQVKYATKITPVDAEKSIQFLTNWYAEQEKTYSFILQGIKEAYNE